MTPRMDDRATTTPLTMEDAAARRWLRRRGLIVPHARVYEHLRATVQERRIAHLTLRRLTHGGLTLCRPIAQAEPASRRIWIVTAGTGWVRAADAHLAVEAGSVLTLPPTGDVVVRAEGPGEMREVIVSGYGRAWPTSVEVARGVAADLTRAIVDALLTSPAEPRPHEMAAVHLALESVVSATTTRAWSAATTSPEIVARAHALIAEHAHAPDFTVGKLAELLAVSRRHLTRVMSDAGRTPSATIREMRLAWALAAHENFGARALYDDAVARMCGFSSARMVRAAVARTGGDRFTRQDGVPASRRTIVPGAAAPAAAAPRTRGEGTT